MRCVKSTKSIYGSQKWKWRVQTTKHLTICKMCPECVRAKTDAQQAQAIGDALLQEKLATSYDVFERDSMFTADLKNASYKTFTVGSDVDQHAKNFAMRLNRFYFKEEGKGNALIVGQSGIGKSHLTVSIARTLS